MALKTEMLERSDKWPLKLIFWRVTCFYISGISIERSDKWPLNEILSYMLSYTFI